MKTLEQRVRDLEEYNNQQDMKIVLLKDDYIEMRRNVRDIENTVKGIQKTIYIATDICMAASFFISLIIHHALK